jgi:hypothetical protein
MPLHEIQRTAGDDPVEKLDLANQLRVLLRGQRSNPL